MPLTTPLRDEIAARQVDEEGMPLHARQRRFPDQVFGLLVGNGETDDKVGSDKQIDVHGFRLFDVATRAGGVYFKELAQLTKKLNGVFRRDGRAYLLKKQKELGDKSIQLTIALYKGGLYLTYAKPVRKRARRRKKA